MEWSGGMPGKAGYLYFEIPRKFYWEFSFCDATNIEDLADKPLKIKFSGYLMPHTPRRDVNSSIVVSIGKVVFARTVDEPNKIFAIQIIKQEQSESMTARYTIIQR